MKNNSEITEKSYHAYFKKDKNKSLEFLTMLKRLIKREHLKGDLKNDNKNDNKQHIITRKTSSNK